MVLSIPLKVIAHCWLHKDSNAADYLADCQAKHLPNISFTQRNDLINWLSGTSETSSYISGDKSKESEVKEITKESDSANVTERELAKTDPILAKALSNERVLVDHNSSLRGSKAIDFGYLIKDAELKLVQSIKSSLRSNRNKSSSQNGISKNDRNLQRNSTQRKDPIILIPSAASSIFTLSNIKQFLQDSNYINPRELPVASQDLITIEKKFDRISRPIRFMVVNNTRMFTKPEYWDRVVAIFTTGHAWQFNNYQWNTPQELFQHCKGYYFHFSGDSIPQTVQQWNVQKVEIDKNKRFKDVEVVRFFWYNLEKELLARGFH
ncbi:hypothetical protein Kpol_1055p51 [Vanderwaltozyma polyspora DSM 70294]|uniref:Cell division control protein 73 C-terminal domain-containing protein n=1 Tax=Vanderwaltozyma polyspora (strain ATCC 22028 / DSM 70294 / BCRC 21397 / CBS 2163 / NBRC 10782 / NRRL Y-8283 / UCD 57-17) TaxID=436907 RepID=A7TGC5_VANPO|nr:uncharacterized protein Kpol_1055p51 [Vanderwaltozyma polyspora DSM 70294]EDO18695.1 hypothetical protein Kpol_1055p51 [Vanderwaltozyma polyspora DSM 70294]